MKNSPELEAPVYLAQLSPSKSSNSQSSISINDAVKLADKKHSRSTWYPSTMKSPAVATRMKE